MSTFSYYEESYNNFIAPQFALEIDGAKISSSDYSVQSVLAQTTASFESGFCELSITDIYDEKKGKYKKDVYNTFSPGSKIKVFMGYNYVSEVFNGYINKISLNYGLEGATLSVSCLDARGVLFKSNKRRQFAEGAKIIDVIKEVLKPCSEYVSSIKVGNIDFDSSVSKDVQIKMIQDNIDDYTYVKKLATLTGSYFCILKNDLVFDPDIISQAPNMVSLKWGESVMNASFDIDLSEQVGNIEVSFRDRTTGQYDSVTAKTGSVSLGGGGKSPDVAGVVEKKELEIEEPLVTNTNQATALAKSLYNSMSMNYVKTKVKTIGIPDIYAGAKFTLERFGKGIDGEYFITNALHEFGSNGYTTTISGNKPKY